MEFLAYDELLSINFYFLLHLKISDQISGLYDTKERLGGTLSSILFSLSQGIRIFRVHNVEEVKQGILVYETLMNKWKKNTLEQME